MDLPVMPPVKPMLAVGCEDSADMHYEAKWNGFRAIVSVTAMRSSSAAVPESR